MATVNWAENLKFIYNGTSAVLKVEAKRTDWIGFMDALGKVEGLDAYNTVNRDGYLGIYQFAPYLQKYSIFKTLNFYNNVGSMLNVTSDADYLFNPVAQELSALMEFSGETPTTKQFSSVFEFARAAATSSAYGGLSLDQFNGMLGQTFTIQWVGDNSSQMEVQTFKVTEAGISAATHLIGQGGVGVALRKIYDKAYDSSGQLISPAPIIKLDVHGDYAQNGSHQFFADGSGTSFATYMQLFQDFKIPELLNATSGANFNQLAQELITYRKDKIVGYLASKSLHVSMTVSPTYQDTIQSVLNGLNLPTSLLSSSPAKVVLAGGDYSDNTGNNDVIVGIGSGGTYTYPYLFGTTYTNAQVLTGGTGNETFVILPASSTTATEIINDSRGRGNGSIYIGSTQLTAPGTVIQYTGLDPASTIDKPVYTWTASDGTTYKFTPDSAVAGITDKGTLTITNGGSGVVCTNSSVPVGETIVIEEFSLHQAFTSNGYLGIQLKPTLDLYLDTINPCDVNASRQGYSTTITGSAATCTVKAPSGSVVTFSCSGLQNGNLVTGATTQSFSKGPVSVTVPPGQDYVTVTLVDGSNANSSDTAQLTASFVDANGDTITSNALAITFNQAGAAAGNVTPDYTYNENYDLKKFPDPNAPFGYYYKQDSAGNWIEDLASYNPNRVDDVSGTSGNDLLIMSNAQYSGVWGNGGNDTVIGGTGSNHIVLGNGNDLVVGNDGQHLIDAGSGNNQIYAGTQVDLATALADQKSAKATNAKGDLICVGDGNNTIVGSNRNDAIFTGCGNNTIVLGAGQVTLVGGVKTISGQFPISVNLANTNYYFNATSAAQGIFWDTLPYWGGSSNDTIFGGTGDSSYWLSNGNNWLDAGGGNDAIVAGTGNNTIYGGTGNDSIWGAGGNNYINLESGSDYVVAQGGNQTIIGGSGNDTIYSGDEANWADSQKTANNYIYGGSGDSHLFGSGGNDTLIGGTGNATISGGNGNEYIVGSSGNVSINGGNGNDTIYAGDGNATIWAGDGNNTIYGGNGNSTITGGAGNDVISAGDGNTLVRAGSGTSVIYGGAGNDTLIAGAGSDTLYGGSGTEVLQGGSGNTLFVAGSGNETIMGGSGSNTYEFDQGFGNIELLNTTASDALQFGAGISASDLTMSMGTATDGNPAVVIQYAGGGQITVDGGLASSPFMSQLMMEANLADSSVTDASGNTTVLGGGGSTLVGGTGLNIFYVQGDSNTVVIGSASDIINTQAGATNTTIVSGVNYTLSGNEQNLTLTGTADLVGTGNNLGNVITANSGNDTLVGGSGNDTFVGGTGLDTFCFGIGSGTDTVIDSSALGGVIKLTGGLTASNLQAVQQGNDLLLTVPGTTDSLLVQGYYSNPPAPWTIQDGSTSTTPDAVVAATALSRASLLEQAFINSTEASIVNTYTAAGYSMQADGSLFLRNLPTEIATLTTTTEVMTSKDTMFAADGTLTGPSTTYTNTYNNQTWNSYPFGITDQSVSVNTVTTTSDAAVINTDAGSQQSQSSSLAWVTMNWVNGSTANLGTTQSSGSSLILGNTSTGIQAVGLHEWAASYTTTQTTVTGTAIGVTATPGQTSGNYPGSMAATDTLYSTQFDIKTINLGSSGQTVYGNWATVVNSNSGNDIIYNAGFAYGGSGNDTMIGGGTLMAGTGSDLLIGGSTMIAGSGADQIFAGNYGATSIQIDPTVVSTDLIGGAGTDQTQVLTSVYEAMGATNVPQRMAYGGMYAIWGEYGGTTALPPFVKGGGYECYFTYDQLPLMTGQYQWLADYINGNPQSVSYVEPLPPVALPVANDFAALAPYYAQGFLPQHTVSFGSGVTAADLQFSWGQTLGAITGLSTDPQTFYTTLNVSWGSTGQSIQVMIPHSNDPLGSGVSQFTFADGTTLSMAQMVSMAEAVSPAPTFDPQAFQYQAGMGTITLGAGYGAINFGPGITSSMITLGLGSLMLRVGNTGDVIHITNFDPTNALAANSVQRFNFADGSSLTYDQLLSRGFDIYGTTGDEVLSGTNLDNRIYAGSGNDTLIGSGTNDTLVAGSGIDTLIGGTGNETFVINNTADVIIANANAASNTVESSVSYVMGDNVQNLVLTGSDNLTATGNSLNDIITGNAGNDTLIAGSGNDTLVAGTGGGTMVGGSGRDTFIFNEGSGQQTIIDSLKLTGDTIKFGPGVSIGNSQFMLNGSDLLVTYGTKGDSVLIQGFAPNGATGSQTVTQFTFGDGSHGTYVNNGWGYAYVNAYDASGNLIGNFTANAYGTSYGNRITNPDGSGSSSWHYPDGSYLTGTTDAQGNYAEMDYDANGVKTGDYFSHPDGSWSEDFFNADGSSYGDATNADGSYSSYTNDGHGDVTTNYYDVNGNLLSYTSVVSDGHGDVTTTNYDASGAVLGSSVSTNDGLGDTSITNYDGTGRKLNDTWAKADGSHGSDTFNADGSSSGTAYNANGSYSSYVNDGIGDVTTTSFDASGNKLSDTWTKADGSHGSDTFNADGTSSGTAYTANGSYSTYTNDGKGDVVTYSYDANGVELGYTATTNNAQGITTTNYNAVTGETTGSVATAGAGYSYTYDNTVNVNGVAGETESKVTYTYADGSTYATDTVYDPNGSYQQSTLKGDGSTTTTNYNAATGEVTGSVATAGAGYSYTYDNTVNVGGVSGVTESKVNYTYADGSTYATDTVYDPNGSYQQSTVKGDGSTTTTNYNAANGEVTGSVATAGAGYSYTYDNTVNVNGVAGETESKVNYTYADGSTYATDTVYDPNGSYQQSTLKGDGSTTTTNYNAATGEVTGSVATAGAGYSYTYDNTVNVNGVAGETESKVNYTYADGSTYSTDTVYDPNGSYQQSTVKGDGSTTTTNYNAATGEVTGSVATAGAGYSYTYDNTVNVNGVAGETESKVNYTYADGSTYATDTVYDPNGSYQQSTLKGDGSTTTTNYNAATGEVTGSVATAGAGYSYTYDNTVNVNGVAGETESKVNYTYADGSTYSTDTVYDPNGSYQQSTLKGDGSTTTTNYNAANGEVTGSVATAGAGYSYTYDNTVNVNGVAGETESKVTYTYADGSTYATDTVYDPNGSYQQSTLKGDGSTTTTNYNAATGEVTGSVATAGAGYSYTYDNTVNVNGMAGETESKVNYTYADGSTYATDTVYNPDGSYFQAWNKSDGTAGSTAVNATGVVTGDSWVHADGTQGVDALGNQLILSGAGSDSITGGAGNDILIGGAGNDFITTGTGSNIIAFNKGDGLDVVNAANGQNNVLSLGGAFAYSDLALQRNGNDLILDVGANDAITLQGWYAGNNKIVDLQVIAQSMTDFAPGSSNALSNCNVENFDFASLVAQFDQACAADPTLTSWSAMNGLLNAHLSGSDTAALGGDLAYEYGMRGNLTGFNISTAQNELSNSQLATAPQTLNPWPTLNTGTAQIK